MTATQGRVRPRAIGTPLDRLDGRAKVTGSARYAYEQPVGEPVYLHAVQATVARGRITGIDTEAAAAVPGVLAVLTHRNAPRLADTRDAELAVLQSDAVAFRGQFVGGVVATTSEAARYAASLVRTTYDTQPHDSVLRPDRDDLYAPESVNGGFATDTEQGDVEAALASAAVTVDQTYTTAMNHNNPMEPHTTVAVWNDGELTLYESTQGVHMVRSQVAPLFGLQPDEVHVVSPFVGGGFGSKGTPHAPVVLAAMAARLVPGRAVRFALTRPQMFFVAGYRTPTVQHIRLGADRGGRLTAISVDAVSQTSRIKEFAEQTAVAARMMYAAPHRRTTHRLARLDVPVPSWMRAPGECPGMFAAEVAMDELAEACGLDPVELRIRNEPATDPETGRPFSSRNLVACLREGARRIGWERREQAPRSRREAGHLVGLGVAASVYPVFWMPGSSATVRAGAGGRYTVSIGAADLGTGTWTALAQIAADALEVPVERVELRIGDTAFPPASVAGGSSGITAWGSAVVHAARRLRETYGNAPPDGAEATGETGDNPATERFAMYAFGAQFAEVRVDEETGEVRVPRLVGVFAAGCVINPKTARSQLVGGMTMGLSMALHEESHVDGRLGQVANHDLAEYHIAANADVGDIDVSWIDEDDPHVNPMGSKGIGEIGIVGTAAAVANAAHNATGVRVRDLPITLDKLLGDPGAGNGPAVRRR
ncbi:xanthine dehydrogenase family protein molybdopterin-binding subunit [Actinacidiphila bryophytorum]|uniref:Aldehyde dehydrogenase: molybdenum cofactor-binding subunit n=1 Tax=Actinacidiphila bryophytorum TaxID=1436133 RepID=A0A9W4MH00_9ACTN|nr:xanthine dehydrogenase family protein molybdopterin-binding subunit [Actinacidiphila bryophytorum]MBM9437084.1 xanthine dehydrogenase family protein molybdopterin-binding subunit [Actinacidiphila bryophytorum]MBN6544180.1 xanthine dehydrogenase family protein molybdopterin-binding subunit [Actinacidiphila bryophytorum]CAG7646562.1 aldehyde dehydrogenase: molybdenum cofactor-binding subunit [Actinacidiphila bryophytorum]